MFPFLLQTHDLQCPAVVVYSCVEARADGQMPVIYGRIDDNNELDFKMYGVLDTSNDNLLISLFPVRQMWTARGGHKLC